jgi:hypothetical protein
VTDEASTVKCVLSTGEEARTCIVVAIMKVETIAREDIMVASITKKARGTAVLAVTITARAVATQAVMRKVATKVINLAKAMITAPVAVDIIPGMETTKAVVDTAEATEEMKPLGQTG